MLIEHSGHFLLDYFVTFNNKNFWNHLSLTPGYIFFESKDGSLFIKIHDKQTCHIKFLRCLQQSVSQWYHEVDNNKHK